MDNAPAHPWPPDGPFDAALIRLPKGRQAQEMVLHAAASVVRPMGHIYLYGTNDEGIRSMGKRLQQMFGAAQTIDARKHSRVYQAPREAEIEGLKPRLADWALQWTLELEGISRPWLSYPGLFAHGRLDDGTRLLLKTLPSNLPGCVLDYGCGTGIIGAAILHRQPQAQVELIDIDALAVAAARTNVPGARVTLGANLDAVQIGTYGLIVSNPPIHTGKGEDHRVLEHLIAKAPSHLTTEGVLMMVLQRRVHVEHLLEPRFREVSIVGESSRYRIWRAAGPQPDRTGIHDTNLNPTPPRQRLRRRRR
ncbi:MAG: methyltransferase [Myxococcota bacterium]